MMGTQLTQMHLHGEVAELHPFALNTVAICWPSPATQERIDKALVFLAHPGNWLAGPQTPFSITHNLTVSEHACRRLGRALRRKARCGNLVARPNPRF